jgi:F-type H+-transporting ATPase subunit delta
MRDHGIATRYAQALVETTKAAGLMVEVAESYATVVQIMRDNLTLPSFLEGPQVAKDEKKELIHSLFDGRVEPILVHFFLLLVDKNRIEYLVDIGEVYAALVEKERGYARAVVTTAVPLTAGLEQDLSEKLGRLTGARILLDVKIDPQVIAGVKVTVGDAVIDGTVRTHLNLLREHLSRAALPVS